MSYIDDPDDTSLARSIADRIREFGLDPRERGRWLYRVSGIGTNVFGVKKGRRMTVLADSVADATRIALERDETLTEIDVWPTTDGPIESD